MDGPRADTDGDGMPDEWELRYGLAPDSAADAWMDQDNDGLSNRDEYLAGTDPTAVPAPRQTHADATVPRPGSVQRGAAQAWQPDITHADHPM